MGYTHSWTQTRSFTKEQWIEAKTDLAAITKFVEFEMGIPLANAAGDVGTAPVFGDEVVMFNGLGDNCCETFVVHRVVPAKEPHERVRGRDFTKTGREPYDVAVTACLCYLSSICGNFRVSSDGTGRDFLEGLEVARRALPKLANQLDIPMGVMQKDRWTGPWVKNEGHFAVRFCVDGRAYVLDHKELARYCWETHEDAARWLITHRHPAQTYRRPRPSSWGGWIPSVETDIWDATGSFDEQRHQNIGRLQNKVLRTLIASAPETVRQPPTHVRPDQLPPPEARFNYYLADVLKAPEEA